MGGAGVLLAVSHSMSGAVYRLHGVCKSQGSEIHSYNTINPLVVHAPRVERESSEEGSERIVHARVERESSEEGSELLASNANRPRPKTQAPFPRRRKTRRERKSRSAGPILEGRQQETQGPAQHQHSPRAAWAAEESNSRTPERSGGAVLPPAAHAHRRSVSAGGVARSFQEDSSDSEGPVDGRQWSIQQNSAWLRRLTGNDVVVPFREQDRRSRSKSKGRARNSTQGRGPSESTRNALFARRGGGRSSARIALRPSRIAVSVGGGSSSSDSDGGRGAAADDESSVEGVDQRGQGTTQQGRAAPRAGQGVVVPPLVALVGLGVVDLEEVVDEEEAPGGNDLPAGATSGLGGRVLVVATPSEAERVGGKMA